MTRLIRRKRAAVAALVIKYNAAGAVRITNIAD
jgi:hypothetical protein